jgi:hypothetical protein|tara:strand:+ start:18848 stop:19039 length:192 start_codon:yes stop_codon:yes gene_type:complete
MGRTNRDRVNNRKLDDEDDSAYRRDAKKKQKKNRRTVEKNFIDAVLSGEYDEYEYEEDFYSDP